MDYEDRQWRSYTPLRPGRYLVALALAASFAVWGGYVPERLPEPTTPVWVAPRPGPTPPEALDALVEMDAALLAAVAKQEDAQAAEAVAWVVLNRAGCTFTPEGYVCSRSFVEVIQEGRAFGTWLGPRWVPSWGRTWSHPLDRAQLAEVEGEVEAVLRGFVPDPTQGSNHFHRKGTQTPRWAPAQEKWRLLGSHYFYQVKHG